MATIKPLKGSGSQSYISIRQTRVYHIDIDRFPLLWYAYLRIQIVLTIPGIQDFDACRNRFSRLYYFGICILFIFDSSGGFIFMENRHSDFARYWNACLLSAGTIFVPSTLRLLQKQGFPTLTTSVFFFSSFWIPILLLRENP